VRNIFAGDALVMNFPYQNSSQNCSANKKKIHKLDNSSYFPFGSRQKEIVSYLNA
jgi:hypothetical protein